MSTFVTGTVLLVFGFICLTSALRVKENAVTLSDEEAMMPLAYVRPSVRRRQCPTRSNMGPDVAMYACPSTSQDMSTYTCVRYEDLCNGIKDCPNGDDELLNFCMFHKLYEHQQTKVVRELKRIGDHLKDEIRDLAREVQNIKEDNAQEHF